MIELIKAGLKMGLSLWHKLNKFNFLVRTMILDP